jgi:hypothetical protein
MYRQYLYNLLEVFSLFQYLFVVHNINMGHSLFENYYGDCDSREGGWINWKKATLVNFTFVDIAVDRVSLEILVDLLTMAS